MKKTKIQFKKLKVFQTHCFFSENKRYLLGFQQKQDNIFFY